MVRCADLRKTFDGTVAIDGISVQFPQGQVTAVVGPNGAGKTTLFDLITGFCPPSEGRCFLGQQEITGFSADRIARLGVARTFQDVRVIQQVSPVENILLALPQRRGDGFLRTLFRLGIGAEEAQMMERARGVIRTLLPEEVASRRSGELSFGQQKILAMACCVATDASVLFLDEPFAGVDPSISQQMVKLVREVSGSGRTVIFIEHDLGAVRRLADFMLVLRAGVVAGWGPAGELLDDGSLMEAFFE